MIDLTPLDVRKKRGDFRRGMRGYDAEEVDVFLEVVADRLEELVKENLTLRERAARLGDQVNSQEGREKAVQDALVTAQELRQEIRTQAQKEAELIRREAAARAEQVVAGAKAKLHEFKSSLAELERQRTRFLKGFRALLERELDVVEVEEKRTPLEDITFDLDLAGGTRSLTSLLDEAGPPEATESEPSPEGPQDAAPASEPAPRRASGDEEALLDSTDGGGSGKSGGAAAQADGDGAAGGSGARNPGQPIVDMFGERKETRKEEG